MQLPLIPSDQNVTLLWLRRDLRLTDNKALQLARSLGLPILPMFIFDTNILAELDENDARVEFIHRTVGEMHQELNAQGSGIITFIGKPIDVFEQLVQSAQVKAICFASDFEPYAIDRDHHVTRLAQNSGIQVHTCLDHLIFHPNDILKSDETPYLVYTPYSRKWLDSLTSKYFQTDDTPTNEVRWLKGRFTFPSLSKIGFTSSDRVFPDSNISSDVVEQYESRRNVPSIPGTSQLGMHLRFGTISIRKLVKFVRKAKNETYLKELIWREFFIQILYHFPKSEQEAFKPKYRQMPWRFSVDEFNRWKSGQTGVPIVDAGMRQLNATGFMHNRVRMITASYLTKNLLHDWKLGERYFAQKLLDFELASNVGNWQWVAGTGCDAAPYFQIFNPYTQAAKFDPNNDFINRWVPNYNQPDYPAPLVDYKTSRIRCLSFYKTHAISKF